MARARNQAGRPKVLLLEDEALIAMDLEQRLTELGFDVVGPFKRNCEALAALGRTAVDLAMLDYLLGEETSAIVADRLERLRVPCVYVTGCEELMRRDGRDGARILGKPISHQRMIEVLGSLCDQGEQVKSAVRCRHR